MKGFCITLRGQRKCRHDINFLLESNAAGNYLDGEANFNNDAEIVDETDYFGSVLRNFDTMFNKLPLEPRFDTKLCLPPTESNTPISVFKDEFAEEKSYPTLFGGKPRTQERIVKETFSRVCKAEMQSRFRQFAIFEILYSKKARVFSDLEICSHCLEKTFFKRLHCKACQRKKS